MTNHPNRGKGKTIRFLLAHVEYDGADCLIWPFNRNPEYGYGMFTYLGTDYYAHSYMCDLVNGPRPPEHQAAHSCGRGHDGCVHPKNLSWKTVSANLMDRREHGTVRSNTNGQNGILTEAEVAEVRALKGYLSQYEIARMFGVKRAAIQHWHRHSRPRAAYQPGTSRSNLWMRRKKAERAASHSKRTLSK